MEEVKNITDIPLVLHGGTGIPTKDIQRAISLGTAKINVNTENQMVQAAKVREVLAEQPDLYDPRKYLGTGRDAIKETVIGKMREFGSSGRAETKNRNDRGVGEKKLFLATADINDSQLYIEH